MEHVGKYRLIERIAVGGTAEVFLAAALRPTGEELVVLKRVLPQHARDPRFRKLFREEALVVARLEHPNIVRLVDFGEMQDTFFLALEHVDGADLAALLDGAASTGLPLQPAHATQITRAVATALAFLHTRADDSGLPLKIVHRDVSPHNILLSRAGDVKLADFGIARSAIRTDRTTDGTIKGKFAYMSPEQARGDRELGAPTDVFALGAVLYELLFGAPPFKGETDVATLERIKQGSYALTEGALPEGHRALVPLLRRCLAGAPEARPTAAELAAELEAHAAAVTTPAETIGRWVDRVAPQRGELDRLAGNMLQARGHTAVLAVRPVTEAGSAQPAPAPAQAATQPGHLRARRAAEPPRSGSAGLSRLRLGLLLVGVAAATSLATLLLVSRGDRVAGGDARPAGGAADATVRARVAEARPLLPVDAAAAAVPVPTPDARSDSAADPDSAPPDAAPTDRAAPRAPRLHVRSAPTGATVLLDGDVVGQAPLALIAPRRGFELAARRTGYLPWSRRYPRLEQDARVTIELARRPPGYGYLTVNSIPWANVYVDGRLAGTTPIRSLRLTAGRHQVMLRTAAGRVLRTFTARIAKGRTITHSFDHSR